MKKLLLSLAVFLLFIGNSSSQSLASPDSVINYLEGHWSWKRSCGGLAGVCYYPGSSTFVRGDLQFTRIQGVSDSIAWKSFINSSVWATGHSKIKPEAMSATYWYLEDVIMVGNFPTNIRLLDTGPDSLLFFDKCADCFIHRYYKNKTVGINETELSDSDWNVFPNPVTDKLYLNFPEMIKNESVLVYDVDGKTFKLEIQCGEFLDVSALKPGIYFLKPDSLSYSRSAKFIRE